jgi:hypothetical protein
MPFTIENHRTHAITITMLTRFSIATLIAFCTVAPANAQQLLAHYEDWRVFTVQRESKKVCYLASLPSKQEGNFNKRSDPYLLVTDKGGALDEISLSSGYPYKEGSEVTLSFGNKRYALFTKEELAWSYDELGDKAIVKEMIRNNSLSAKGVSWKGTHSTDTYSLKGFTQAHRHMKRECKN